MTITELDIYVERLRTFRTAREYTLTLLLPRLEAAGVKYRILDRFTPSDTGRSALLHIDLTEVPEEFMEVDRFYERAINAQASSIRKTLYTTASLRRESAYAGPVIVKTVLNSGGLPEVRYRKNRSFMSRAGHELRKMVPGYKRRLCPPYAIFQSLADVPEPIWMDERLFVEKFLPGGLRLPIVKYRYCFLFETSLTLRTAYDDLLCSSAKVRFNGVVDEVPEAVRAVRARLGVDFGAIDYFMVDETQVVIDVNKTPSTARSWMPKFDFVSDYVDRLGKALIAFAKD